MARRKKLAGDGVADTAILLRVTHEERDALRRAAAEAGTTMTSLLLTSVLANPSSVPVTAKETVAA